MDALRFAGAITGVLLALALLPGSPPELASADNSLPMPALLAATAASNTNSATGYIGREVKSPDGTRIGHVAELIVDAKGQATHVIVVPAALTDADPGRVMVPWESIIGLDEADDSIVITPAKTETTPLLATDAEPPVTT